MSGRHALVDWDLAGRIAGAVGDGLADASPPRGGYAASEVEAACGEAIAIAGGYAGLGAVDDPPVPELIDRRAWADNALRMLAEAARPIEEQIAAGIALPGPLGAVARRLPGAAAAAEAGVAVGYVARKVLGQYDLALFGPARPARLLFVAENMENARRDLDADPALFLRWVALHEATHVIQLERVDWLADHVRGLAAQLIEAAAQGLDASSLRKLARQVASEPRQFVRGLLRGELARLLADAPQRAVLDSLQATMSVIEGHAEHVMDSAAPELGPELPRLRRRLEERRLSRSGIGDAIGRLLGMDLKARQYRVGKAFCDSIVTSGGIEALSLVWRSPGDLPDLAELESPRLWMARVAP